MNKKNLIIFILVLVLIFGCGALYLKSNSEGGQNTASTSGTKEVTSSDSVKTYTLADVATHSTSDNCWMAIDGSVYDATSYIASGQHNPQIIKGCGIDATTMFHSVDKHSGGKAQNKLVQLKIGVLSK